MTKHSVRYTYDIADSTVKCTEDGKIYPLSLVGDSIHCAGCSNNFESHEVTDGLESYYKNCVSVDMVTVRLNNF